MLARLREHSNAPDVHFYCSSGGNAGLAATSAARSLGRPCTVVVPLSTKPHMITKIRAAGAHDVIQIGDSWREADTYMRTEILEKTTSGVYVPPFDHPDIWEGNSKIVDEIQQQLGEGQKPDALICSVGGGGLFNGINIGMDRVQWNNVPLLAMETHGADSLHKSLLARELVTLPGITSRATCLGATRVAQKTFENAQRPNVRSLVLSDAEAAMGCWRLADDEHILVEMACGVTVALCYDGRLRKALGQFLDEDSKVVIVVCGGSDTSVEIISKLREDFGASSDWALRNGHA